MVNHERKAFALKPRQSISQLNPYVANTVRLDIDGLPETCLVEFSDRFVDFIGEQMPQGVSHYNPAYISVSKGRGEYAVWASYVLDDTTFIKLWRSSTAPSWIPEHPNDKNSKKNHS